MCSGIHSELFYVRDGIINTYALSFNMRINADIKEIYFTWQSLRDSPQVYQSFKNVYHAHEVFDIKFS